MSAGTRTPTSGATTTDRIRATDPRHADKATVAISRDLADRFCGRDLHPPWTSCLLWLSGRARADCSQYQVLLPPTLRHRWVIVGRATDGIRLRPPGGYDFIDTPSRQ